MITPKTQALCLSAEQFPQTSVGSHGRNPHAWLCFLKWKRFEASLYKLSQLLSIMMDISCSLRLHLGPMDAIVRLLAHTGNYVSRLTSIWLLLDVADNSTIVAVIVITVADKHCSWSAMGGNSWSPTDGECVINRSMEEPPANTHLPPCFAQGYH